MLKSIALATFLAAVAQCKVHVTGYVEYGCVTGSCYYTLNDNEGQTVCENKDCSDQGGTITLDCPSGFSATVDTDFLMKYHTPHGDFNLQLKPDTLSYCCYSSPTMCLQRGIQWRFDEYHF